jgi:hypothetical protein
MIPRLVIATAIACVAVLALVGCASTGTAAPPQPTRAELMTLVSEQAGSGPDGYRAYGVSLHRFIAPTAWGATMTACVGSHGITQVDFTQANNPYWTINPPEGAAALKRALAACTLQFPETTLKPLLRTDRQWNYQYDYLSQEFVACVRSAGATVGQLVSRNEFLRDAHAFTAMRSPFALVTRIPSGLTRTALAQRCPATAPGL